MDSRINRRRVLAGVGAIGAGLLAGCNTSGESDGPIEPGIGGGLAPNSDDGVSDDGNSVTTDESPVSEGKHVRLPVYWEPVGGTPSDIQEFVKTQGLKGPFQIVFPGEEQRANVPGASGTYLFYEGEWVGSAQGRDTNKEDLPKFFSDEVDWTTLEFDVKRVGEQSFEVTNVRPTIALTTRSAVTLIDWQPTSPIHEECREAWCRYITNLVSHEWEHATIAETAIDRLNELWPAEVEVLYITASTEEEARSKVPGELKALYEGLFSDVIQRDSLDQQYEFHVREQFNEQFPRGPHWPPFESTCASIDAEDCGDSRRFLDVGRWHLSYVRTTDTSGRREYFDGSNEGSTQSHLVREEYRGEFELTRDPDLDDGANRLYWAGTGSAEASQLTSVRDDIRNEHAPDYCATYGWESEGTEFVESPESPAQLSLRLHSDEFVVELASVRTHGTEWTGACDGDSTELSTSIAGAFERVDLPACGTVVTERNTFTADPVNETYDTFTQTFHSVQDETITLRPIGGPDSEVELNCRGTE